MPVKKFSIILFLIYFILILVNYYNKSNQLNNKLKAKYKLFCIQIMSLNYEIIPKYKLTYLKCNIKYIIFPNITGSKSRVILLPEPCNVLHASK